MAARVQEPPSIKTGESLANVSWRLFMPFTVLWDQELPGNLHFGGVIVASPINRQVTRTFTFRHLKL